MTIAASNTFATGSVTDPGLLEQVLCSGEGYYTPFGSLALRTLYPTHGIYVSKYTEAAKRAVADGFLTQSDYDTAVAAAQAARVP